MKILFAASEAHPIVKTGGLGDVAASLPAALKKLRHDVRLILPAYRQTLERGKDLRLVALLHDVPGYPAPVRLLQGRLPDSEVPLFLVDAPALFDRTGGPYLSVSGNDWPDNAERFAVFCRAVVEIAQNRAGLAWRPDVVHCNDWQTGLIPALLALELAPPATVFTIHNLAYRGLFPAETFLKLDLPKELWTDQGLEFHKGLAFIKGGLAFADWLTTVSPTYAREIRTHEYGWWLEGLLEHRADRLLGILNGADYDTWDPLNDPLIEANYGPKDLGGKAKNKAALQRRFGLAEDPDVPLIGQVGRLVDQKGIDLLVHALPQLLQHPLQIVILGTGEQWYEDALIQAAADHPGQIAVHIGYDEQLAHLVEAGADIFVMPSRFEPCGLNQIYSLRYGTVPIVRRTGGLADTVVDATEENLAAGEATGFVFDTPAAPALAAAVERALTLYGDREQWRRLLLAGMRQDFSWKRSAKQYLALYEQAVSPRGGLSEL